MPIKKRWIALGLVIVLGAAGYIFRIDLLVVGVGIISKMQNPIGPSQEVVWTQGPATASAPANERKPNVIVILVDDMGFNDITTYGGGVAGGTMPTPNIDRLAAEGVTFMNGYAGNAVCAPSRAMLLTGRYSTRFGFEFTPTPGAMGKMGSILNSASNDLRKSIINTQVLDNMPHFEDMGMVTSEITLAELLREQGYYTAHIGKWHLGRAEPFRPTSQGFDESLMMASGLYLPENDPDVVNSKQDFDAIDRFLWANMQYAVAFNDETWFEPDQYLTDYFTDNAVDVIAANTNQPFFLYLAHWGVHTPLQALKSDYDGLNHIENHRERVYGAMVKSLDRSVGKILDALEENGIDENTIVIFTSDNGGAGYIGLPEINQPYRGWKLTLFEGGTHVPFSCAGRKGLLPVPFMTHRLVTSTLHRRRLRQQEGLCRLTELLTARILWRSLDRLSRARSSGLKDITGRYCQALGRCKSLKILRRFGSMILVATQRSRTMSRIKTPC